MKPPSPTKEALLLSTALNNLGIETKLEHFDGHKHIDIYLPKGRIFIEIDGLQHYTNHLQIIDDFTRDHYSDDAGFHTLHISNGIVNEHSDLIARALKKMLSF